MTIIHLGVIDHPYTDGEGGASTGDVAEILEGKYGVMQGFVDLHGDKIAESLTDSLQGAIESLMAGSPVTIDPFGSAVNAIKDQFNGYLEREEVALTGASGVPTESAKMGASKRFKRKKGPARPSFIDSGQYQNAFTAWVE